MVVFIRFLLLIIDVDGSNRANLVLDKGLVLKYSLYFRSGKRLTRGEIDSKRIIELFGVCVCVCVERERIIYISLRCSRLKQTRKWKILVKRRFKNSYKKNVR